MSERWHRFIGIGLEDPWGSPAAATAWLSYYGKDSLREERQYLDLDGTQESRSRIEYAPGDLICEGEVPDIEMVPDTIGLLLEACFGSVNAGVYTLKDGALPSLTIEKQVGSTEFFQCVGMKVQELRISARARETVKMNASLVGKRMIAGAVPTERGYSSKLPFVFYQGTMQIDGGTALIREFEITITNNLPHPNMQSGDIYSQEHVEGVRDVTGTILLDFLNTTHRNKFLQANSAFLNYKFVSGGDSLELDFPKVIYPGWSEEEEEVIYTQRLDFRALKKDANNKEVKATLIIG